MHRHVPLKPHEWPDSSHQDWTTNYQIPPTEHSNGSNSSIQPLHYRVKILNSELEIPPILILEKASSCKALIHTTHPEKLCKPCLLLSFLLFLAQAEAVTLLIFLCPRPHRCLLFHTSQSSAIQYHYLYLG